MRRRHTGGLRLGLVDVHLVLVLVASTFLPFVDTLCRHFRNAASEKGLCNRSGLTALGKLWKADLVLEDARLALPNELLLHRVANALNDLVIVQKVHLALRRVDVDVHGARVDVQAAQCRSVAHRRETLVRAPEVDEGGGAFGEDAGVHRLYRLAYFGRLHQAV